MKPTDDLSCDMHLSCEYNGGQLCGRATLAPLPGSRRPRRDATADDHDTSRAIEHLPVFINGARPDRLAVHWSSS